MYGFNERNKSQVRPGVLENIHTISVCVCVCSYGRYQDAFQKC